MKKILILLPFLFLLFSCKRESIIEEIEEKEAEEAKVSFGIDISEYQGDIDWEKFASQKKHPIEFVIIRSSMGDDRKDAKFQSNFREAKARGFMVGAYHYYDPNEKSELQAKNFLETVRLEKGDFIPIVDIENISKVQTMAQLKIGLQKWLDIVEKHYGVRPMIYTGFSFYLTYLADEFSEYPLWIAAYTPSKRGHGVVLDSEIHQFTEKVRVSGIKGNKVDGNDIKKNDLPKLLLK